MSDFIPVAEHQDPQLECERLRALLARAHQTVTEQQLAISLLKEEVRVLKGGK